MKVDAVPAVKAHDLVFDFFSLAALVAHHDRTTADTHWWRGQPPNLDDFFLPLRMVFKRVGPHDLKHFRRWTVDASTGSSVVNHDVPPASLMLAAPDASSTVNPISRPALGVLRTYRHRRPGRVGTVGTCRSLSWRMRPHG